jgi:hypothetical protein
MTVGIGYVFILEFCVDCWISIVDCFWVFKVFKYLEFWVSMVFKFLEFLYLEFCCYELCSFCFFMFYWVVINEFGNLIFGVFELCCFMINEFGILQSLIKSLSFTTSHYAIGMQLVVIYNYWSCLQLQIWYCIIFGPYGCVCNNVQLNVYNMDMYHKNNGLN